MIDKMSIKEGMLVMYKGKQYVVVCWDIVEAGNVKEVGMVKTTRSIFKKVKYLYNEELDQLTRV